MENKMEITNLGGLQLALLENDLGAIKTYIERIDRSTANQAMKQAGEMFGFPTTEINGVVYASGTNIAEVLGYKTTLGLQKLLESRGIEGVRVGGFIHKVKMLQEDLHLDDNDYKTLLYDWPAFLIGGMNTQNEAGQKVQAYLLKMEQVGRVALAIGRMEVPKVSPLDKGRSLMALSKLAESAWKGNPIARWILEEKEGVPVKKLLQESEANEEPDISRAAIIVLYFDAIMEPGVSWKGITRTADWCEGTAQAFYQAFLALRVKRGFPKFFDEDSIHSFGSAIAREARALDTLGWIREKDRKITGDWIYKYTRIKQEKAD